MDEDHWLKQLNMGVRTLLELIYAKVKVPIMFEISQRTPARPALPQVYLQNIIYSLCVLSSDK